MQSKHVHYVPFPEQRNNPRPARMLGALALLLLTLSGCASAQQQAHADHMRALQLKENARMQTPYMVRQKELFNQLMNGQSDAVLAASAACGASTAPAGMIPTSDAIAGAPAGGGYDADGNAYRQPGTSGGGGAAAP
jgi:hypothetical protein